MRFQGSNYDSRLNNSQAMLSYTNTFKDSLHQYKDKLNFSKVQQTRSQN